MSESVGVASRKEACFATAAMDAAGIPLFAASMLEPSEIIVGVWRPSAWFVFLRSARILAFIVLCTMLAATAASAAGLAWSQAIVQLGAVAIVARLAFAISDWTGRVYVLTDRRVLRRRGVLSPTVYSAELRALRRIDLVRSPAERIVGVGTVTFSARMEGGHDAAWVMVARAPEIHALVVETKRRYGK